MIRLLSFTNQIWKSTKDRRWNCSSRWRGQDIESLDCEWEGTVLSYTTRKTSSTFPFDSFSFPTCCSTDLQVQVKQLPFWHVLGSCSGTYVCALHALFFLCAYTLQLRWPYAEPIFEKLDAFLSWMPQMKEGLASCATRSRRLLKERSERLHRCLHSSWLFSTKRTRWQQMRKVRCEGWLKATPKSHGSVLFVIMWVESLSPSRLDAPSFVSSLWSCPRWLHVWNSFATQKRLRPIKK